jgi:hypothetical protein
VRQVVIERVHEQLNGAGREQGTPRSRPDAQARPRSRRRPSGAATAADRRNRPASTHLAAAPAAAVGAPSSASTIGAWRSPRTRSLTRRPHRSKGRRSQRRLDSDRHWRERRRALIEQAHHDRGARRPRVHRPAPCPTIQRSSNERPRYSTAPWQRLRKLVLALLRPHLPGRRAALTGYATTVHHLVPSSQAPHLFWEPANPHRQLRALQLRRR